MAVQGSDENPVDSEYEDDFNLTAKRIHSRITKNFGGGKSWIAHSHLRAAVDKMV